MEGLFVSMKVRIFIFKANKSSQRSYTTRSCSQMPGASSSALLGDIMLINIQKVVETPYTTVLLGIQKSLQLSPEHRTLPNSDGNGHLWNTFYRALYLFHM